MEQGREIGELARGLFPEGRLVSNNDQDTAEGLTEKLLSDSSTKTLFEAAFVDAPFIARPDILTRHGKAWHILEVKSSFADSGSVDDYIDDLAYTAMVAARAGLKASQYSLVLLSRSYRFGDSPDLLFKTLDVTKQVRERAKEFDSLAGALAKDLLSTATPTAALVSSCRQCPYFDSQCLGKGLEHTVLELPKLSASMLKRLSDEGIVDLARLPAGLELSERQERVRDAALSGNAVFGSGLRQVLDGIPWPCHYLDFETVATVRPLYKGHACHQQVLTQFSIHHRDSIESECRHSEYLADPKKDCEKELAEELIRALGKKGSVIVYSGFEKTRIQALQARFPTLSKQLQAILDRIVDLLPVIRDHVYHPDFRGSFSIKAVLPALVPALSYKGLAIASGDTAIARFARMARGEVTGAAAAATRGALLKYCALDTMAMVRLHEVLWRRAAAKRRVAGR